jgi:hypothetical protein
VKPYENIVTFESMVIGFADAVERFQAAEFDPVAAYNALFEALNWTVALDDRARKHWAPEGKPLDWAWRKRLGHGAEVLGGVRYARNRVHHQWSDAMTSTFRPTEFVPWMWRPEAELPQGDEPDPRGEASYVKHLEGRPVQGCLDVANAVFYTLQILLEPHTIRAIRTAEEPSFPVPERDLAHP